MTFAAATRLFKKLLTTGTLYEPFGRALHSLRAAPAICQARHARSDAPCHQDLFQGFEVLTVLDFPDHICQPLAVFVVRAAGGTPAAIANHIHLRGRRAFGAVGVKPGGAQEGGVAAGVSQQPLHAFALNSLPVRCSYLHRSPLSAARDVVPPGARRSGRPPKGAT